MSRKPKAVKPARTPAFLRGQIRRGNALQRAIRHIVAEYQSELGYVLKKAAKKRQSAAWKESLVCVSTLPNITTPRVPRSRESRCNSPIIALILAIAIWFFRFRCVVVARAVDQARREAFALIGAE